jgi:antitoxin component of MazEF toxin-antitoxin module
MAVFKTKLVKWGNSVGVVLPKPLRDTFKLEAGNEVELVDRENYVIIRKTTKRSTNERQAFLFL